MVRGWVWEELVEYVPKGEKSKDAKEKISIFLMPTNHK